MGWLFDHWRKKMEYKDNIGMEGMVAAAAAAAAGLDLNSISNQSLFNQQRHGILQAASAAITTGHSPVELGRMIDMRLRTPPGKFMFQFMQAFKMGNEKVVVFIVQGDQPTFLEDDWALFPSDELTTKLRLILG